MTERTIEMLWDKNDVGRVLRDGFKARKTTETYFIEINGPCIVKTEEGDVLCEKDGYLASDGVSRVWPVSKEYFNANYERIKE